MLAARLYRAGLRAPRGVRSVVVIAGLLAPVAAGLVPYALWHNAWLSPAFALLIVTVAHGEGKSTLSRLLGVRGMCVLGESSYALYLLHVPVLYWIAGLGERRTGTKVLDEPLVASTAFAGCLLVAWLAWRFIEVPLRRQLRS
jgi:peptidoglycan/LPS O-acetylase OafA/YrhL